METEKNKKRWLERGTKKNISGSVQKWETRMGEAWRSGSVPARPWRSLCATKIDKGRSLASGSRKREIKDPEFVPKFIETPLMSLFAVFLQSVHKDRRKQLKMAQ